jgi:hypothetical protein
MWHFIESLPEASLDSWYRWLTFFAIGLPILGAITGGICGWGAFVVSGRVSDLQTTALHRLEAAKQPRHLTEQQKSDLSKLLRDGPKGQVVITTLSLETDAPEFAQEIYAVLSDAGFGVQISDKIWLRLKLDGFYIVAANARPAPAHTAFIQRCFQTAGIRLKALEDPAFFDEFQPSIPKAAAILVISNRE